MESRVMGIITDEAVVHEFVAEMREHLETVEPDLLAMEKAGGSIAPDMVNRVFRAIHSIKGSAGFVGFKTIVELGHGIEAVLDRIRKGKLLPDPGTVDALLTAIDKLRAMMEGPDTQAQVSFKAELERLAAILEVDDASGLAHPAIPDEQQGRSANDGAAKRQEASGGLDAGSGAADHPAQASFQIIEDSGEPSRVAIRIAGSPHFEDVSFIVDPKALESVVGAVQLYALAVHADTDLKTWGSSRDEFLAEVSSYGENLSLGQSSQGEVFHVVLATVMDPDLIGDTLRIPRAQIYAFEPGFVDKARIGETPGNRCEPVEPQVPEKTPPAETPVVEKNGPAHETIRIGVDLVDKLMNLAGELVLGRNQLRQMLENHVYQNPELAPVMQNVDMVTSELQEFIMQMRLQPIGKLFNKFPRLVRDLSRQLAKEIELSIEGLEVELDKSIVEALSDPLTHLVRNCVDHAIEPPEERIKAGKSRTGKVHLVARHEGGQVIVTIRDDGKGIDAEAVVNRAIAQGIIEAKQATRMTEQEKLALIFRPGLSTARTVTDISGRGVGMDVVKTNVERQGGYLELETIPGQGTTISIRLPLTLAIIPSLIVGAGNLRFAIPQINVKELVCVTAGEAPRRIEKVGEAQVLRLRGQLLAIVCLSDILQVRSQERRPGPQEDINLVVLRAGSNRFGLSVDEVFDTQEIVVKPLSKHVKDCRCFAGATIMGDGKVAMILDASGIAEFAGLRFSEIKAEEQRRKEPAPAAKEYALSGRQSILVFSNAPGEYFALPTGSVSRLEMVDPKVIERIGGRDFVTYRGDGLPLISLDRLLPVQPISHSGKELYFIIPKNGEASVGILASRILDTIEAEVSIQKDSSMPAGVLGCAVVDGRLTMFLDPQEVLGLYKKGLSAD